MNRDFSILVCHAPDEEITMVSMYIDNLFFALNRLTILDILKKTLSQKYSIKDLEEVQTIIKWQIIQNSATRTLNIN